jgi:hypothetical protein
MFDSLPSLSAPQLLQRSELEKYLNLDTEAVEDPLVWWFEHKHVYPHLSRMALDYLSIPGE